MQQTQSSVVLRLETHQADNNFMISPPAVLEKRAHTFFLHHLVVFEISDLPDLQHRKDKYQQWQV